ncbi:MAG: hypothetical protein IT362_11300 [Deltaproteobacteria bacterium]|nr:hypothetical protein [Deltaproteobacteria bacterium]
MAIMLICGTTASVAFMVSTSVTVTMASMTSVHAMTKKVHAYKKCKK